MGGSPVQPRVIEVLESKFVGKKVTIDQLTRSTGFTRNQVNPVMLRLSRTEGSGVTAISLGVWAYRPDAPEAEAEEIDTLFEVVGRTAEKAEIIARGDVTGRLYKVVAF